MKCLVLLLPLLIIPISCQMMEDQNLQDPVGELMMMDLQDQVNKLMMKTKDPLDKLMDHDQDDAAFANKAGNQYNKYR